MWQLRKTNETLNCFSQPAEIKALQHLTAVLFLLQLIRQELAWVEPEGFSSLINGWIFRSPWKWENFAWRTNVFQRLVTVRVGRICRNSLWSLKQDRNNVLRWERILQYRFVVVKCWCESVALHAAHKFIFEVLFGTHKHSKRNTGKLALCLFSKSGNFKNF